MRTRKKVLIVGVLLVLVAVSALYGWYRYEFPYGFSHCCDLCLWFSLREYAESHGGRFPAGEAPPEASLSLLYRAGLEHPDILRGKTVPESIVREILDRGDLLGPDTCGWHYVEGLTLADDPRLALFWDKAGLGHNGGRMHNGDRCVGLIGDAHTLIPGEEWPEFLREQEKLLAARSKAAIQATPILAAKVRLPSGETVDHFDAPYTLTFMEQDESATRSGRSLSPGHYGGNKLTAASLRWWELANLCMPNGAEKGTLTLTLTLGQWRSKPVQIDVSNGVPRPDSFVFEMMESNNEQPQGPPPADQPGD